MWNTGCLAGLKYCVLKGDEEGAAPELWSIFVVLTDWHLHFKSEVCCNDCHGGRQSGIRLSRSQSRPLVRESCDDVSRFLVFEAIIVDDDGFTSLLLSNVDLVIKVIWVT